MFFSICDIFVTIVLCRTWFADIFMFEKTIERGNFGFKYLLLFCDGFSNFLMGRALRTKRPFEVVRALKECIIERGAKPTRLITDRGTGNNTDVCQSLKPLRIFLEFTNHEMQNFLKEHSIQWIYFRPPLKAQKIELMGRWLKTRIYRYLMYNNTKNWYSTLQHHIAAMNDRIRPKLNLSPSQIDFENEIYVFNKLYKPYLDKRRTAKLKPKYRVGQLVRLRVYNSPDLSTKGYQSQWTDEIYKICGIVSNKNPVKYRLCDLNNFPVSRFTYYRFELQPVSQ